MVRFSLPGKKLVTPGDDDDASSSSGSAIEGPLTPDAVAATDSSEASKKSRYWPSEAEVAAVLERLSEQDREMCDAAMANRCAAAGGVRGALLRWGRVPCGAKSRALLPALALCGCTPCVLSLNHALLACRGAWVLLCGAVLQVHSPPPSQLCPSSPWNGWSARRLASCQRLAPLPACLLVPLLLCALLHNGQLPSCMLCIGVVLNPTAAAGSCGPPSSAQSCNLYAPMLPLFAPLSYQSCVPP